MTLHTHSRHSQSWTPHTATWQREWQLLTLSHSSHYRSFSSHNKSFQRQVSPAVNALILTTNTQQMRNVYTKTNIAQCKQWLEELHRVQLHHSTSISERCPRIIGIERPAITITGQKFCNDKTTSLLTRGSEVFFSNCTSLTRDTVDKGSMSSPSWLTVPLWHWVVLPFWHMSLLAVTADSVWSAASNVPCVQVQTASSIKCPVSSFGGGWGVPGLVVSYDIRPGDEVGLF